MPVDQNIIIRGQDVKESWKSLKQSIVNLFYSIIDEGKYGIWNINKKDGNNYLFTIMERSKRNTVVNIFLDNNYLIVDNDDGDFDYSIHLDDLGYDSIVEMLDQFPESLLKNKN